MPFDTPIRVIYLGLVRIQIGTSGKKEVQFLEPGGRWDDAAIGGQGLMGKLLIGRGPCQSAGYAVRLCPA